MRSGDDHCDQALADDVRRRSLQSRAGRKEEEEKEEKEEKEEGGGELVRGPDIKSNNPHLAGGERRDATKIEIFHDN